MESEADSTDNLFSMPLFILLLALPFWEVIVAVLIVVLLLLASALVSGSEVAYFSLEAIDYDKMRLEKGKSAQRILVLKEKPQSLLAAILIANNFINIAIVVLSEFITRQVLPQDLLMNWSSFFLSNVGLTEAFSTGSVARIINFIITVVGATFLLVLFGEVVPKVYARINNVKLAKFMSGPLTIMVKLFQPLSYLLVNTTQIIERRLETKNPSLSLASKEDYDKAIDLTISSEKNSEQEVDILKSIVNFGKVSVKQITQSRVDVIAVEEEITFSELLKVVKHHGFSRLPVFKEDFDSVTGILYAKDILGLLEEPDDFKWQKLIRRDVLFVPESKKIDALMEEFQLTRMHMAIVVDESGGTSGIVTMEDVMEEVIGEIRDEFDDTPNVEYRKVDDFTYIFEGKTLLNDVCRITNLAMDSFEEIKGEADSLAGLILELVGYIPKANYETSWQDFKFKVLSTDKRRIKQIKITIS